MTAPVTVRKVTFQFFGHQGPWREFSDGVALWLRDTLKGWSDAASLFPKFGTLLTMHEDKKISVALTRESMVSNTDAFHYAYTLNSPVFFDEHGFLKEGFAGWVWPE